MGLEYALPVVTDYEFFDQDVNAALTYPDKRIDWIE